MHGEKKKLKGFRKRVTTVYLSSLYRYPFFPKSQPLYVLFRASLSLRWIIHLTLLYCGLDNETLCEAAMLFGKFNDKAQINENEVLATINVQQQGILHVWRQQEAL